MSSVAAEIKPGMIERLRASVNPRLIKQRQIRGGGKSEYIPHQVYSRILGDALAYKWSWEIVTEDVIQVPQITKGQSTGKVIPAIKIHGRLTAHGLGSWSAIGVVKLEDEESWKKADTAAFRKACDRAGIAGETWDNRELYDEDEPMQEGSERREDTQRDEVGQRREENQAASTASSATRYTPEQIAHMKDIKETYRIGDNDVLMKLVNQWEPQYEGLPTPADIDSFIQWVRRNPDECEAALG